MVFLPSGKEFQVHIEGKVGPRINLNTMVMNRILSLLGIEPQSPVCPRSVFLN